jgi:MFS family permease
VFKKAKSSTVFYGWFVVAACFAITASLGEACFLFGVFFKPLETEFGWSRSLISLGSTAFMIGYAVSVVVSGRLADRYKPRFILLPSACLAGLGITLCSQINSVDQLCCFLFIAGLGSGATFSVPTSTVQRWFCDRRSAGTALAVVVSGIGVGELVFPPLINHFILSYGWRNSFLIAGIITFAIIFISSLVIRQSPMEGTGSRSKESAKLVSAGGCTTAKAVATLAYAGIIYAACVALVAFQTLTVHIVPHAADLGMSSTAAAATLSLLGGLSIAGRLTSGFIFSRIGWQKMLGLSTFGMAASLAWLLFLNITWMLYSFVFIFGIFWGMRVVAQVGILGEFFGLCSVGELIGIASCVSMLFGAAAPYIAGFIFDTTGSYFIAFAIMTVLLFSGAIVVTLMKKPLPTPK